MQRLRLTQDFGLGHQGDEVAVVVSGDGLIIEHHEFDPGALFPWATEIAYDELEHVTLQARWGAVLRLPATLGEQSADALLALRFTPAARRRLGSGLGLAGTPQALEATHRALQTRCDAAGQATMSQQEAAEPLGPDELEWFDRLVYGAPRSPEAEAALCAAQQRAKASRWPSSRRALTDRIAKLRPRPVEEYVRFMD